ncbi:MAG: YggT family protein [Alphaproteobacteria bacterium]|nr:YggT family protein [Alphaproteobacteria bacterium]
MYSLFRLVDLLLLSYSWVLIIGAVISWLMMFDIINRYNPFVNQFMFVLRAITEPLLRPIRRIVRPINGFDFSPIILLLAVFLVRNLMYEYWLPAIL